MTEKKLAERLADEHSFQFVMRTEIGKNDGCFCTRNELLIALREMQSACVKVAQASCGCDNHDCDALRCIVAHEIAENIGRL